MDQNKVKIIYTAALYYCFIACGLCFSIFNPTLLDLKDLFDTSLTKVSLAYPIRSAGYVVGSLSCGIVTTLLNRQLVLVVILVIKSLTIALVPHWHNVYQFYGNAVFNGFFTAGIDTTVNVWLNEMWGSTGGPYMQALHFFFGIGAILGPILAQPFLSNSSKNATHFSLSSSMYTHGLETANPVHLNGQQSQLYIPYSIAAAMALLSAAIFFVLFCIGPYRVNRSEDQQPITNSSEETDNSKFRCPNRSTLLVTGLSSLFLLVFAGSETSYFQFSASFATQTDLKISKSTAAYMASALALSFTSTRALSILIAMRVKAVHMLYADCVMIIGANTLMLFLCNTSETAVWIGNIGLGVGFASVFPSFYPLVESSVQIGNMMGSLFIFSTGLSSAICPLVVGLFIEHNPLVLIYLIMTSLVLSIIVLIALDLSIRLRAKSLLRTETNTQENSESS